MEGLLWVFLGRERVRRWMYRQGLILLGAAETAAAGSFERSYYAITKDEEPCSSRGTWKGRSRVSCNRQINVRFSNQILSQIAGQSLTIGHIRTSSHPFLKAKRPDLLLGEEHVFDLQPDIGERTTRLQRGFMFYPAL